MDSERTSELQLIAQDLRILGLEMVREAKSGHIGGAFSLSEIMATLYFEKMNIDPGRPDWEDRDRLVMSKGHATVALYPTLAKRGFFPIDRLKQFRKIGGHLSGHAEMNYVAGVDMSTGSLGQGFSVAVGMALGAKMAHKKFRVFAILGDGEIQEGQIWEAAMFAAAASLDNLVAILDYNKVQLDGTVAEVQNSGPPQDKFAGFGFNVITIDGHSIQEIADAIDAAAICIGKPTIIIANTVKGKGVSFMEGKSAWHGKTPSDELFDLAFAELKEQRTKLEAIHG
ncbi:MAG: transketolase [Spirochaetia bacterium]|nr:transketolase [Bacteroidia bacterium]NCC64523.1 transketolase [Spirochaetia bacterium]